MMMATAQKRISYYPPSETAPGSLPRSSNVDPACPQACCLLVPHPHTGFRNPVSAMSSSSSSSSSMSVSGSASQQQASGSQKGSPFSVTDGNLSDSLSSLSLSSLVSGASTTSTSQGHRHGAGGGPHHLYAGLGHSRANITKRQSFFLLETIRSVNPQFEFNPDVIPRRILTKPPEPIFNGGCDNSEYDLILVVNDIIGSEDGHCYQILELLGHGTFGQVVRCRSLSTGQMVAVKVIKNKPAYFKQSLFEVQVLELLNKDSSSSSFIIQLVDHFIFRKHLCMAFELLGINLYELLKFNQFRGLSLSLVRIFTTQILQALVVLHDSSVIHCDLKPENILLKDLDSTTIKVIDFGSACMERNTLYTYIQSRFYRSPEVLLGLPYSAAIDMWSLGCICAELFLGLPLFPGSSEYNQLSRITEMIGVPPTVMIESGKNGSKYFQRLPYAQHYQLKPIDQFSAEYGVTEKPSKRYFEQTNLTSLIENYPTRKTGDELMRELERREVFLDFLRGILCIDPYERWTPRQAQCHPFLRGERSLGSFKTPPDVYAKDFLRQIQSRANANSHSQQPQQSMPQQQQYQPPALSQGVPLSYASAPLQSAQKPPPAQQQQQQLSSSALYSVNSSTTQHSVQTEPLTMQKTVGFSYQPNSLGPTNSLNPPASSATSSTSSTSSMVPMSTSQGFGGSVGLQGNTAMPPFMSTMMYLGQFSNAQTGPPNTSGKFGSQPKEQQPLSDHIANPPGLGSFSLGTSPSGSSYSFYSAGSSPSFSGFHQQPPYQLSQQQQQQSQQQQQQQLYFNGNDRRSDAPSRGTGARNGRGGGSASAASWDPFNSSDEQLSSGDLSVAPDGSQHHLRKSSWGSVSSEETLSLFSFPLEHTPLKSTSSSDVFLHMGGRPEDLVAATKQQQQQQQQFTDAKKIPSSNSQRNYPSSSRGKSSGGQTYANTLDRREGSTMSSPFGQPSSPSSASPVRGPRPRTQQQGFPAGSTRTQANTTGAGTGRPAPPTSSQQGRPQPAQQQQQNPPTPPRTKPQGGGGGGIPGNTTGGGSGRSPTARGRGQYSPQNSTSNRGQQQPGWTNK